MPSTKKQIRQDWPLAQDVFVGVLLSGLFFAHKVGRILHVDRSLSSDGGTRTCCWSGCR